MLQISKFTSEQEEADWWYDNREALDEDFSAALRDGRAKPCTLMARLAAARSVELAPEDSTRAREPAQRRGMDYKDFVRSLIHEALERESSVDV